MFLPCDANPSLWGAGSGPGWGSRRVSSWYLWRVRQSLRSLPLPWEPPIWSPGEPSSDGGGSAGRPSPSPVALLRRPDGPYLGGWAGRRRAGHWSLAPPTQWGPSGSSHGCRTWWCTSHWTPCHPGTGPETQPSICKSYSSQTIPKTCLGRTRRACPAPCDIQRHDPFTSSPGRAEITIFLPLTHDQEKVGMEVQGGPTTRGRQVWQYREDLPKSRNWSQNL